MPLHAQFARVGLFPMISGVIIVKLGEKFRLDSDYKPTPFFYKTDTFIVSVIPFQPILQTMLLFFLLRVLEVRHHNGDLRDACRFGRSTATTSSSKARENEDVIEDEDEDVRGERERVEGIMNEEEQEKVNS